MIEYISTEDTPNLDIFTNELWHTFKEVMFPIIYIYFLNERGRMHSQLIF